MNHQERALLLCRKLEWFLMMDYVTIKNSHEEILGMDCKCCLSHEYIPMLATILGSYNLCDPQIWWYFINPPNMPTGTKIRTKLIFYIPIFVHLGLPWVNHSFIIEHFPYRHIFVLLSSHSLWMWELEKTEAFLRGKPFWNFLRGQELSWKFLRGQKLFWKLSERTETFLKTFWEGTHFF